MKYYFIDKEIYYQNKKMPDRKVELFDVEIIRENIFIDNIGLGYIELAKGYDKDGNFYKIDKKLLNQYHK